jgi:hypothetical protein
VLAMREGSCLIGKGVVDGMLKRGDLRDQACWK